MKVGGPDWQNGKGDHGIVEEEPTEKIRTHVRRTFRTNIIQCSEQRHVQNRFVTTTRTSLLNKPVRHIVSERRAHI